MSCMNATGSMRVKKRSEFREERVAICLHTQVLIDHYVGGNTQHIMIHPCMYRGHLVNKQYHGSVRVYNLYILECLASR